MLHNVYRFGPCLSTTITVKQLLAIHQTNTIDPDFNREVTGTQRTDQKSWMKSIAQSVRQSGLLENEPLACPFSAPIVYNVTENYEAALRMKNEEKLISFILKSKQENIDGNSRTGSLRKLVEQFEREEEYSALARLLDTPVRVDFYFGMSNSLAKLLFMRINYNIKKVSPDVSMLFLQQIYKDDPEMLSAKETDEAQLAAITYDIVTTSKLFKGRVRQMGKIIANGPTYIAMISSLKKNIKDVDFLLRDESEAVEVYCTGWKALASQWVELTDAQSWETFSHNNVIEVGTDLITKAIQQLVNREDDDYQLSYIQAQMFFRKHLQNVFKVLKDTCGGNPLITTEHGGVADQFSSAAGKAKLLSCVELALTE